jgi:nucleoside-diphosphate-sugar epimerase
VKVLVAGGAGFIGSHLCEALLDRGDKVVAVDNFVTGKPENVAHLIQKSEFSLVEHDVTVPLTGKKELDQPFDAVLGFASPASPDDFAKMPLEILEVGSTGTRNLLDLTVKHAARFMLASTSEVYGDPLVHPQTEDYFGNVDPVGPRSCYDEAKRFSEALVTAYHRVHGLEVRIARIFNTYGPRMRPDDGRVLTNFIMQALTSDPITLYGDGSRTRSFCYVDDEVNGLLAVLDSDLYGPVNVGNPTEITIREVAELVKSLTGSASQIVELPLPSERTGDPQRRCPDITKIRTDSGWVPSVSLSDGLKKMIESLSDQRK